MDQRLKKLPTKQQNINKIRNYQITLKQIYETIETKDDRKYHHLQLLTMATIFPV